MKAVLQRVREAHVAVQGETIGSIGNGLLVLLGVEEGDTQESGTVLADKLAVLRIFEDTGGKMNLSLCDVGGEVLVVSQFTLCADCAKGRRPSFMRAAQPERANALYELFMQRLRTTQGITRVESGRFGADMQVSLINDGPVTLILDTRDWMKVKE